MRLVSKRHVVVIILSLLAFCAFANGVSENSSELVSFSFSHNGMAIESCYTYTISDPELLSVMSGIIDSHNVRKWDGFSKTNPHVLDGEGFSLELSYSDGKTVRAYGNNSYPDGYRAFYDEFQLFVVSYGILPDMDSWSDSEYVYGSENLARKWSTEYSFDIGGLYMNYGSDLYLIPDGRVLLLSYVYAKDGLRCIDQFFFGTWSSESDRLRIAIPELEYDYESQYRIEKSEYGTYLEFMTGGFYPSYLADAGSSYSSKDLSSVLGVWSGNFVSEWDCYKDSSGAWYSIFSEGIVWALDENLSYYLTVRNGSIPSYIEVSEYSYEDGVLVQHLADGSGFTYELEVVGDNLVSYLEETGSHFIFEHCSTPLSFDASLDTLLGSWTNENEAGITNLHISEDGYTLEKIRDGMASVLPLPFTFHKGFLETELGFEPFVICNDKLYFYVEDYTPEVDRTIEFTFVFDRI